MWEFAAHTADIFINLNLGGGFKENYEDSLCGGGKGGVLKKKSLNRG